MNLKEKKCEPCEVGTAPVSFEDEEKYLSIVSEWQIHREGIHKIDKVFKFKRFMDAIDFVNKVANIAEEEGHHPNIIIKYNKVEIELYTHAIKGLSINDFIMASKIDVL